MQEVMFNSVHRLKAHCPAPGLYLQQYLRAAFEEKALEPRAAAHQGLDAILGDLITPRDVELLQQGTTLT